MRVGTSPNKSTQTTHRPARVTVCVLVSIPSRDGYYAHRLEVVRLSLASLLKHTPRADCDVLVFDNGSCREGVDALRELLDQRQIQFLMLSATNLGKANAYRLMFQAAPGEIVAYTDDDVLFYPGWLDAQVRLLEGFPRVGMVSGLPVNQQFAYGNRYLDAYLREFPAVRVERGRFIPDEWERDFAVSTGREEAPPGARRRHEEVRLTYQGLSAYSTAAHFQFVAWRSAILRGLPQEFVPGLMRESVRDVDERMDELGYARLSTTDRHVRHIGNVVSRELVGDLERLGLRDVAPMWQPPGVIARTLTRPGAALRRLRTWHYFASRYRPPRP